jgi:hypothetical protein
VWKVLDRVSRAGSPPNEDAIDCQGSLAWIIDGATSLSAERCTQRESDGLWLVDVVTEVFRSEGSTRSTPTEVLRTAISEVSSRAQREWSTEPVVPPSAAVGLVRADGDRLDYAVLADVSIVYDSGDGPIEVTDSRPDDLNVAAREHLAGLLAAGTDFANSIASTRPLLAAHRREKMNSLRGYWVLSLDVAAADSALTGTIHTTGPILLASDGFTRGSQLFGLWQDWRRALSGSVSLEVLADEVRATELDDPQCFRFPRWSVHDDLTAGRLAWHRPETY